MEDRDKGEKVLEKMFIAARASISPKVKKCPKTGTEPSETHLMLCRACRRTYIARHRSVKYDP